MLGDDRRCFFEEILQCVADTTPSTFGRHPFYKKGNLDRIVVFIYGNGIIYFCNKSGNTNRKKVFKFKNFSLAENESLILKKNHILYENMTTRKLFSGQHIIEININGKSYEKKSFLLY